MLLKKLLPLILVAVAACASAPMESQTEQMLANYPTTANATASALGYGTFDRGWLFNTGTTQSGSYGGETVTRYSSTATTTDPLNGSASAWRFSETAGYGQTGGSFYDVTPANGFTFVTVMRLNNTGTLDTFENVWRIATADGEVLDTLSMDYYDGELWWFVESSTNGYYGGYTSVAAPQNTWMVVVGVVDSNSLRIAVHPFSGTPTASSNTSVSWDSTTISDCPGRPDFHVPNSTYANNVLSFDIKGFWMGRGSNSGLDANISAAAQDFYESISGS